MEQLLQILQDWGYAGTFLAALLAGSILPFSSELVLVALLQTDLDPVWLVFWTTLGNTAGGMTCYWIGTLGKMEWIYKHFNVKKEKIERFHRILQGKGAMMAAFTCLPYAGEPIAICLGLMRSNVIATALFMFIGKLARYLIVAYVGIKAGEAIIGKWV